MCIVPENRLVIKAVALNTSLGFCVTEILYKVIYIFVHVNLVIGEVRSISKSAVLLEYNFIPALGGCCFACLYFAVLISSNISSHLKCSELILNIVLLCDIGELSYCTSRSVC